MELENILKNCKYSKDKYEYLVKNIGYYISEQKQQKVRTIMDSVVGIDRTALSERIEIWKEQEENVRNFEEFEDFEIRIKVAEAILNALTNQTT